MARKKLSTTIQTLERADAALLEISKLERGIQRRLLAAQKRIDAIRESHDREVASDCAALKGLSTDLLAFIQLNPDLFKEPRSRVTAFGSYGMRTTPPALVLPRGMTESGACEILRKGWLDVLRVKYQLDKEAIKSRPSAVERLGATIEQRDEPWFELTAEPEGATGAGC